MRPAYAKLLATLLCAAALAPCTAAQTNTLFTISAPSPAAAPAGSGAINVSLTVRQNSETTLIQQYGFCLYTGVASTAVARTSSSTASNPTFAVPASDFDISPTSFSSGQYTARINIQVLGAACSATSTLSNSLAFPISFPTIASVSLEALAQPNSGVGFASYPTSLEINGANLNSGSGANFTFTSQTTPGIAFQAGTYLPSAGSIIVPVPTIYETGATGVLISACNTSTHYRFCSATASLASFALAPTTTNLTSSIASPTVGQATTLLAKVTSGPGSTTAGGLYAPGTPGGTVTFADGSTALGTASLVGSGLTFATASPQTISAPSNLGYRIGASSRRPGAKPRPNDTPTPDNSTAFSSILADFNLDGVKDVLILDANSGNFHLLLGASPTGNFRADNLIASGCSYLSGATTADLNGDGFPDIAYLCLNDDNTSSLFALYNLGDGTFGPSTAVRNATGAPLLTYGYQIGSGDLNKDGKIDLVVTGAIGNSDDGASTYGIQTFLGNGTGGFTAGRTIQTPADPGSQLVVKDLNNDGAADLVLLSSDSESYQTVIHPYLNNGTGFFTASSTIPVCDCFTYTAKLFVTPLTANALYPDMAVALPDQAQTLVALNQRTSALAFAPSITASVPNIIDAIIGDLNGDGLADLVFFDGTTITTLNGDGTGHFAAQPSSPNFTSTGYSALNASLVAATDINQDGYADLITIYPGNTFTSTINTYLTSGSATASLPATFSTATTHSITTSYSGNVNLLGSTGSLSLPVTQAPPAYMASLAITAPPSTTPGISATQVYTPGGTFSLNFTVTQTTNPSQGVGYRTPGGTITVSENRTVLGSASPVFASPGISTASLNNFGSATTGIHTFTIAYSGDSNFSPITTTYTYTVTPALPTVTWSTPAGISTNTPLDSTILNATANVPGVFRYTPASGYLAAGSQMVSALFTPTDTVNYQNVTTNRTINVSKTNASSSNLSATPTTQTYLSGTPTVLTATIAGLNITPTGTVQFFDGTNPLGMPALGSTSAPATAAATVSLASLAAGVHAFRAVYSGDSVYNAATPTLSYSVGAAAPVLTYSPVPATITYGTTLVAAQFDAIAKTAAGATIPGSFTYNHAAGDLLTAGSQTLIATFTPTDATSYQGGTVQAPLTVNKAVPVITWNPASPFPVNKAIDSTILNATANVPGTFTYPFSAGSFLPVEDQFASVTFTPTDGADYTTATATREINGIKATTVATLTASPATQTTASGVPTVLTATLTGLNFNPGGSIQFFDGASSLGTYSVANAPNSGGVATLSIPSLTAGPHTFKAFYNGDNTYNSATSNLLSYGVGTSAPILTYRPVPSTITYPNALVATQFNAVAKTASGATIPGSFTYNHATGDILTAGTQTLTATFTPTDTASFQGGTVQAPLTVNKGTPVITWNPASPFPINKPIDSTILNATANIPGTFTYPFTAGSFLPVQDQFASVTFTPTDAADYTTATATREINGIKATTVATLTASPASQTTASTVPTVLTATLTGLSFNPGGSVQFFDGASSLGSPSVSNAPNSGGVATLSIPTLAAGPHTFKAVYSGDNTYNPATSNLLSYGVGTSAPVLTYTPLPATITYGTALVATQLNAIANTAAGATIPGSFTYNHAVGDILMAGIQTLTAIFTPTDTSSFQGGTVSSTLSVLQSAPIATLAITSGGSPVATVPSGSVITLTATVPAASGQVNFCDASAAFCTDIHLLGTAQLTSAGTATFRFLPGIGAHTYRAVFLGNTDYTASSSTPVPLTVTGTFATTTTLATSGTPTNYVLTATVVGSGSPTLNPAGSVSFLDASNANNPVATAALGTATSAQTFTTQPASGVTGSILATSDFNGDGIPDVITGTAPSGTTNPVNQTLSIYLGNGDGTFALKSTVNIAVGQAVTGDFNHDGITDIALSSAAGNTISILLGNGDGTFTLKSTTTVTGGLGTLLVADFDHDGLLDLATGSTTTHNNTDSNTTTYTGTLTVLLGAGDGTFRTVQTSTPVGASSLATADFNGDGIPDLVAGDFFAQTATIFLGKGDGTFSLKSTNTIQNAQNAAYFTTADFNGDGIADLASLNFYDGTVTILLGKGDGTFAQKASFSDPTAVGEPNSFNIASGDFNQDGIADLAVTADDGVSVYLGTGDGTFTMSTRAIPQTIATEQQGHEDFGLLLADFNGDGLLDIATAAPNVTIALNTITATATATASNVALTTYGPHPISASYPGDGNFAASSSSPTSLTGQPNTPVLTFNPTPTTLTYGTLLPATLFNATATTPTGAPIAGAITYSHAVGDLLTAGSQTLTATFTPTDPLTYTALSVSRTLTVTRAAPTLTWTPPATIIQGTPLSSTQLNASAVGYNGVTLPGAFVYTPAVATILPSGAQTLSVTFTPTDAVDYLTATTTVPITVNIPAARAALASATNPTQYGQPTTLTATLLPGGTLTAIPTGSVSFFDGTKLLGTPALSPTGLATLAISTLTAGIHTLTATYLGDTANATVTSSPLSQTVTQATPVITFTPNPSTIPYGTPITAAQLNATVTSAYLPTVPGAFAYTYAPTFTTIPGAGITTITASFTPTDTVNFASASRTATVTVTKATPVITFPTAPTAVVGTPLSTLQLNPTVTGVAGPNLPGTLTFTPNTGVVTSGPQTLNVTFTPADTADYNIATTTVVLNGTAVTLTGLSSSTALLGDPTKTITLTGTGFVTNSVARANGAALTTTFVNTTTLTAILPASNFLAVQTLQITVFNPTQTQTTAALPFSVTPAPVGAITFTGPSTANSGDQPTIRFSLTNPYPVDLTATLTLSFAPIAGGVDDPAIQFRNGGRTFSFNLTAGQTVSPTIQLQSGTVAGTIQVSLALFITNGGTNVTPASVNPILITIPPAAPAITSVTVTRSGRQLTVNTFGLSNTRAITQATFHFTPAAGKQIQTQDITLDVTSLFSGWYSQAVSATYGSTFLYTQTFNLDDDATVVGQVTLTLSNGVGASASGSSN